MFWMGELEGVGLVEIFDCDFVGDLLLRFTIWVGFVDVVG